jgi:electron transfer flavoprotein alpha subunit
MKILAFAEQREGKFKKVAFEVTQAGRKLADQLHGELVTLTIGDAVQPIVPQLGAYGATRVLAAEDTRLRFPSVTAYAKIIAAAAQKEGASVVLLPASQMGKEIAPRVSAKLSAGLASDCVALKVEGENIIATRPVYAGKAFVTVRVGSPVRLFSLRPNVFTASPSNGAAVAAEKFLPEMSDADFAVRVTGVKIAQGRPDVTEAGIIVSGGRGLKAPENFRLVEELADVLGAAVGASRAVVDAGWRPHDEQVGQTGKTVSPSLYIACGISGAVQHLAGMSSSKFIVAINKDKDAPIFQVADYGLVGDALEILPALTEELKKTVGK